jgi:hypothetical protein
MQLVIDFIFYLYVYSTCFERQTPITGIPLTVYTASSFLCLCLSAALSCKKGFLQDSAADRLKHRVWRLYVRRGALDDERLTLETCRVIHV